MTSSCLKNVFSPLCECTQRNDVITRSDWNNGQYSVGSSPHLIEFSLSGGLGCCSRMFKPTEHEPTRLPLHPCRTQHIIHLMHVVIWVGAFNKSPVTTVHAGGRVDVSCPHSVGSCGSALRFCLTAFCVWQSEGNNRDPQDAIFHFCVSFSVFQKNVNHYTN